MTKFNIELENRIIGEALYTIDNNSTVRETALYFGVTKSTIHKDLTIKLQYIDISLYNCTMEIINKNKSERASRGGKKVQEIFKKTYEYYENGIEENFTLRQLISYFKKTPQLKENGSDFYDWLNDNIKSGVLNPC